MSALPPSVGLPLKVNAAPDSISATEFVFVVPGHRQWRLRSVYATVSTAVGGQPNRGYTLSITDGTNTVAKSGAADNGTEPASGAITWTDAPAASSKAGQLFASVGSLAALDLDPGYRIIGDIVNAHAGDAWVSAVVWYEYTDTFS